MINKLFSALNIEKKKKEYRNADLYNILGQDYSKILEWVYGRNWDYYIKSEDSIAIVNERLNTNFTNKDDFETILLTMKSKYLELEKV